MNAVLASRIPNLSDTGALDSMAPGHQRCSYVAGLPANPMTMNPSRKLLSDGTTAAVSSRRNATLHCAGSMALVLLLAVAGTANAGADKSGHAEPPFIVPALSDDARQMLQHIRAAHDNRSQVFAIVDKKMAAVHIFDPDGVLRGSSPVLLGLARGDDSVPGIGQRDMAGIRVSERTTPAGRFIVEPGRNLKGEDIVWIDYEAAVSMHRVRAGNKSDRRMERLATPDVSDNRISYGCINVPAAFYDAHIKQTLGSREGVVYVLPETRSLQAQFGDLAGTRR